MSSPALRTDLRGSTTHSRQGKLRGSHGSLSRNDVRSPGPAKDIVKTHAFLHVQVSYSFILSIFYPQSDYGPALFEMRAIPRSDDLRFSISSVGLFFLVPSRSLGDEISKNHSKIGESARKISKS